MDSLQPNVTGRPIPRLGLTPDEAAISAGVSRTKIFEAIRDGALTARKRKLEEHHPAAIRYRVSRLTKVPRVSQKAAAEDVMGQCYRHVSGPRNLPAQVRQIFYQARPKIMALTDDRELNYGYFSQTLLPDYQDEYDCSDWNVIYDARGHCEEPHTNRRFGCGTLE